MEYSLLLDGDDDHVRHIEATSAEDAMRQLLARSTDGGPVRATFLPEGERGPLRRAPR